ncbi:hypothetical protein [Methanocella conradii]|uniref:hypothetical protein n=1 Tax=Methanocella conradii TaxID=1175444 RepID=UPI00157D30BC|nr:hypothetical protein [Methanocella conradii]
MFEEEAGSLANCILLKKEGNGFVVEARKNAVSQYVSRLGKYILLYKGALDW